VIVIFYDEPILLGELKKIALGYDSNCKLLCIGKKYLPSQITVEKYPTIRYYKSPGFPNTTDYVEFSDVEKKVTHSQFYVLYS
jgi:hypothetical protein